MKKQNNWLSEYRKKVTSQFGEDGIIEKMFEVIKDHGLWCVDIGALDGRRHSNTWNLLHNKGWFGVLVEVHGGYFKKLQENYRNNDKVFCLNEFVSFEGESSLDSLFKETPLPRDFDLLSIDIDGNDVHVWDSIKEYSPKVVVVEFNPSISGDIEFMQPRDMGIQQGVSILSTTKVAQKKGYELVAATACNAFFVRKEFFELFGIADNSPLEIWKSNEYQTRLFQLYDGTLMIDGCDKLIWHGIKIDPESIQVLSRSQRKYPARVGHNKLIRKLKDVVRGSFFYSLLKRLK